MQSETDSNSISTSPKCTYVLQRPSLSRDSHDDNKSPSNSHATLAKSPTHSRMSLESHVSGPYRFSLIEKHHHHQYQYQHQQQFLKKKKKKGWVMFSVIDEDDDGEDDDGDDDEQFTRWCRFVMVMMGFVMVFVTVCVIIWGASRPYKLHIHLKSWKLNNFYYGEGLDYTGVPTKLLTINCSVKIYIQNPATFFGIHVSFPSLSLFYSQIMVGSGQFTNYYQPKKSGRTIFINVEGEKVPLYGVGEGLDMSNNNAIVPLKLDFEIRSQAYLVGPLVCTMHHHQILCIMKIDSQSNKVFAFKDDSCSEMQIKI